MKPDNFHRRLPGRNRSVEGVIRRLKKESQRIARDRRRLTTLREDVEELEISATDAIRHLTEAIDALSRYV